MADAGLPAHGLTQPCYFHGDDALYARALRTAEERVNGRSVTHNFLHLDAEAGEAVVSVWTGTNDYFWNTQERGSPEAQMFPEALADHHLTADGRGGRLATLLAGGPLVLVTHWQALYSNGTVWACGPARKSSRGSTRFGARRIDVLTVTIPMPWPLTAAPAVWIGGRPANQASGAAALTSGAWLMRGSLLTVSLPLLADTPATIRVQRSA